MSGDTGLKILIGGLLAPIVFGTVTGLLFGDFSGGAGFGAIVMIGTWVLLFIGLLISD